MPTIPTILTTSLNHDFTGSKLLRPVTFHAKMGSIKDRNGMDLTETKDIKKRWQKKNCTKKIFTAKIIMMV